MGFFDKIINKFNSNSIKDPKPVHEFIWYNTTPEVISQNACIGAELNGYFLTFYLIDPKDTNVYMIKSYQLNQNAEYINAQWFNYKPSTEREKILVLSPQCSCCRVFTDRFVIVYNSKPKILEITIPYNYFNYNET